MSTPMRAQATGIQPLAGFWTLFRKEWLKHELAIDKTLI